MDDRISHVGLQMINVIAVIGTILFNSLVNILPLNGVNTGAVSDSYPNIFTPPGYVFGIWGVIYVLIGTFMLYQVRASQKGEGYLREIGLLYSLGTIFNIAWLSVFHYSYGNPSLFLFTPFPIIALLLTLILTYLRLGIGMKEVTIGQKLAVHVPVSVYLGWISLAMIANVASVLNVLVPAIPLDIQAVWTAAVVLIALVITLLMLIKRRDIAYSLVVVWASVGIATKQTVFPIVCVTALLGVIGFAIISLPLLKKKGFKSYYLA